jgi:hypothetical protein
VINCFDFACFCFFYLNNLKLNYYSTVASFKVLRREEKAFIGQSQFSAVKLGKSFQGKIGKCF